MSVPPDQPPPYQPPPPPPHQPPPPPAPSTAGALAWGLGLLVFVCVPIVSSVIASVTMAIVGRSQRHREPLVAENGRRAANWGLTYLLLTVLLVGGHFTLLFVLTSDGSKIEGFFPFGIIITTWVLLTVVHVGLSVAGLIAGLNRKVLRVPAIAFFVRSSVTQDPTDLSDRDRW